MSESESFLFVEAPSAFHDADALLARVPRGTRGKRELLALLARQLVFPAWFGHNWDALSDCLRDFHWLADGQRVVIAHDALPLTDVEQRRIYLDVLRESASSWHPGEAHSLVAVFPMSARRAIAALL
jgi:hypothetical protein